MKIVISTDLYYPMINGVAMFSHNLAMGLSKLGHEVLVLAPSITGEPELEEDIEGGFRVARLTSVKFPFYPDQISKIPEAVQIFGKKMPRVAYKNGLHVSLVPYYEIKRLLDDFGPDLIHNQTPGPVALAILRYAKKYDLPLVSTGHAYPDNVTGQLKLPTSLKKPVDVVVRSYFASFLRKSEYATMPTELAIADLLPKNHKKFKVPVEALSNGIDLSRFSPGKVDVAIYEKYALRGNCPTLVYVGRIDPEKSLSVLIKAFAKVRKKVKDAQLVVVGDGSDKSKLEALAQDLEIDDATVFTGRVLGADLLMLYRVAQVFAITSTTETQSIVLMEAMASGLPCVAVRAGAIPELVKNNKNGFLCDAGDVECVADGLTKILADKDLQAKMSKQSLELIKKHDIEHTLKRIEDIYEQVLAARRENYE